MSILQSCLLRIRCFSRHQFLCQCIETVFRSSWSNRPALFRLRFKYNGARSEFQQALAEMHEKGQVRNYLLKHNCDWIDFKFNVPHSSHMSGAWERQIRTVHNALEPLLLHSGSQLNDEDFRTFLTEIECIINLRPLSIENICDPTYFEPLTPNHLLTKKPNLLLPPPTRFLETDQYARKRWRRV